MNTTPEHPSDSKDPNKKEGANSKQQDFSKMIQGYSEIRVDGNPYNLYLQQQRGLEIFRAANVAGDIVAMNNKFTQVAQGNVGAVAAQNPELVAIATKDRELQAAVLSDKDHSLVIIPEAYKPRGAADLSLQERTGGSIHTFDEQGNLKADNKFILDVKGVSSPDEVEKLTEEQESWLAKAKAAMLKPGFDQDALDKNAIREARKMGLLIDEPDALPKVESNTLEFTEDDNKYKVIKTPSAAGRNNQTPPQPTTPEEVSSSQDATPHIAPVAASPVETQPALVPKVEASALENKAPTPEALEAARKLKELEKFKEIAAEYTKDDDILRPAGQIMESSGQRLEIMEKDASKKIENITSVLEVRKEKSRSRLEALGLGIKKGLDYYRGMKPRNKLLLGVLFAGASVLSGGGVTGMAIAAVTKTLAAGSYGAGFYDKMLKVEQDKGNNPNKSFLVARSILYGTVFALGTSALFSELASHVHIDTEGIANAAKEKFSAMKEGLKTLFGVSPGIAVPSIAVPNGLLHDLPASSVLHSVPTATEYGSPVWVDQPVITQPDGLLHDVAPPEARVPDTVIEPAPVSGPSFAQPESFTPPAEYIYSAPQSSPDIMAAMTPINVNDVYTMQPGDSTSSILQRVLATIPESQTMSVDDKAALVTKLTKEWLTPIGSVTSPNWALKEMMTGLPGTQVHHLNHVRDAFNILIERANPIKN